VVVAAEAMAAEAAPQVRLRTLLQARAVAALRVPAELRAPFSPAACKPATAKLQSATKTMPAVLTNLSTVLLAVVVAGTSPAPPVYPGATLSAAPAGLGEKPLPKSAKVYVTPDDFSKVRSWYREKLQGVPELAQPGKEDSMDAFLLGQGPSATVLMIERLDGKTWLVIGPPQ